MISTELRGYFTGLILGDGYIDKGVTKRAFRIKSINLDFIDKIASDLEKTNFKIQVKDFPATFKNGVDRLPHKELYISAHPYFNKLYNYFYTDEGNRYINPKVLDWLTPQGWANWFMSDGYIVKVGLTKGKIVDRRVEIATDRYGKEGVELIMSHMKKQGWNTKLVKRNKKHYRVRIALGDAQDFLMFIEPHMTESMRYKLNLAYDYQPKWMCDEYYELMTLLQSTGLLTNPYKD